jgi:hypothetical protein
MIHLCSEEPCKVKTRLGEVLGSLFGKSTINKQHLYMVSEDRGTNLRTELAYGPRQAHYSCMELGNKLAL